MIFADLWGWHPRDVERLTVGEFRLFREAADTHMREAEAQRRAGGG